MAEPFWGPIDAMHQFCEAKYVVSPYFAEFWNTVSNVPAFMLPGLFALARGHASFDLRQKVMWLNMIIVGLGSFLFHLTMRFRCELLDEIPMMILVLGGVLCKDDTRWFTSGAWRWAVHAVCFGVCIGGTFLYIYQGVYERFIETFTLICLLDAGIALSCCLLPDRHGSWAALGCLIVYAATLIFARLLWEVELQLCPAGRGGNLAWLHVAWHLLAGVACYFGMLSDMHVRWSALGVGSAVDEPGNCWPLVGLFPESWRRPRGKGE